MTEHRATCRKGVDGSLAGRAKIPKWFAIGLLTGLLVYLPVYIGVTQSYGVPFWWAFPVVPFAIVGPSNFELSVNPESPTSLGQTVTVTVSNSLTKQPVSNATVNVIKDGTTIYQPLTNQTGQVEFPYPGEPTILRVEKEGYETQLAVIPEAPEAWVRARDTAILSGVVSSTISFVGGSIMTFLLTKRKRRRRTERIGCYVELVKKTAQLKDEQDLALLFGSELETYSSMWILLLGVIFALVLGLSDTFRDEPWWVSIPGVLGGGIAAYVLIILLLSPRFGLLPSARRKEALACYLTAKEMLPRSAEERAVYNCPIHTKERRRRNRST